MSDHAVADIIPAVSCRARLRGENTPILQSTKKGLEHCVCKNNHAKKTNQNSKHQKNCNYNKNRNYKKICNYDKNSNYEKICNYNDNCNFNSNCH